MTADTNNPQPLMQGMIVEHPKWGLGKILETMEGGKVVVYLRDMPEKEPGDAVKTISTAHVPLRVAPIQSDPMLDNLPEFKKGRFVGRLAPRLSLDAATASFLGAYPRGFEDDAYVGDLRGGEREYKLRAHRLWHETLGDGQLSGLLAEGEHLEAVQRVSDVDGCLNLLSPDEKTALKEALTDAQAASRFLGALDEVVRLEIPDRTSFGVLIAAVVELPQRDGGARVATWPVLTQFPYIACPAHHMLFKPSVVRSCAPRLNFNLRYQAELTWHTYSQLLKMSDVLMERLKPLGARDYIDVQSFMWLIGQG